MPKYRVTIEVEMTKTFVVEVNAASLQDARRKADNYGEVSDLESDAEEQDETVNEWSIDNIEEVEGSRSWALAVGPDGGALLRWRPEGQDEAGVEPSLGIDFALVNIDGEVTAEDLADGLESAWPYDDEEGQPHIVLCGHKVWYAIWTDDDQPPLVAISPVADLKVLNVYGDTPDVRRLARGCDHGKGFCVQPKPLTVEAAASLMRAAK